MSGHNLSLKNINLVNLFSKAKIYLIAEPSTVYLHTDSCNVSPLLSDFLLSKYVLFCFFYERIEKTIIKKRKKGKFKMSASRSSIRCLIASALTSLESNELLKDEAHQAKIFFHFVRHMNKVYFSCVYVFELLTLFLFS